jgi:hypothetical protein
MSGEYCLRPKVGNLPVIIYPVSVKRFALRRRHGIDVNTRKLVKGPRLCSYMPASPQPRLDCAGGVFLCLFLKAIFVLAE